MIENNIISDHFTVEELKRVNCEYPGEWDGEVETGIRWQSRSMAWVILSF